LVRASTVESIRHLLDAATSILVITHIAPDGDAIGSLTSVGQVLKQFGKFYTLVCDDDIPERFSFLPLASAVRNAPDQSIEYDLIIGLDAGDPSRLGRAFSQQDLKEPVIINIDHHVTNTKFGQINLVDTRATATAEILYHLFLALDAEITPELATALLTGLVTDTLGFRTAGVTKDTLQTAGELVEAGANLFDVTSKALTLKPMSTLLMWQKGLNNVQLDQGVIWTSISYAEKLETGYKNSSSFGLGNMLAEVNEAAMSAVLTETGNGRIKVGFRCRPPYIVSRLAMSLAGGGHDLAAGCTLEGTLEEVEALVISKAKESIRNQKAALERVDPVAVPNSISN